MDERVETEWQWFGGVIRDSLLRPRRFAAAQSREHYGLAGVLVARLLDRWHLRRLELDR